MLNRLHESRIIYGQAHTTIYYHSPETGFLSADIRAVWQYIFAHPAPAIAQEEMRDSATVIMYHRFGEDRYPSTNIRLAQFEEHLALLTNGDYTVLPLPEIVATLQAGGSLPTGQSPSPLMMPIYLSMRKPGHACRAGTALHRICGNRTGRKKPPRLYELGNAA